MKLISILFVALAVVPPWYFWRIRWWVCLLVGIIIFIICFVDAGDYNDSLSYRFGMVLKTALMFGAPLWLYGYGGWRFLIYGLLIGIIGVTVIYVFSKWREKWKFQQRYIRVQKGGRS